MASESHKVDRTVLPPPDPPFEGKIDVAFKDLEPNFPEPLRAPEGAPNVLLIMGDDIGYGHMGAFGGPARTPVFDRLAARGLIFSNIHTTPVCSASRAAVLTGRNSHSVGMGCIPEASVGFPGYNAVIPRSAATVLEIMDNPCHPPPPRHRHVLWNLGATLPEAQPCPTVDEFLSPMGIARQPFQRLEQPL